MPNIRHRILFDAVKNGNIESVKSNLNSINDLELRDIFGYTLLHWAAKKGKLTIIHFLLEKNNEPNIKSFNGSSTPMHLAAIKNHFEVVKALLNASANPNLKDIYGRTPLHYAVKNRNENLIKLLLKKEANPNIENKHGRTPLHWAAMVGKVKIIKLLLDNGAHPNIIDDKEKSPLYWPTLRGHTEIVKLLLKKNEQLPYKAESYYNDYKNLLSLASQNGHLEIARMLLESKIMINLIDEEGWSPLHRAASEGHFEIVSLLLDAGFDINLKSDFDWTPLHDASDMGSLNIVKLLLEQGAQVDATDSAGNRPLLVAAVNENTEIVVLLINKYKTLTKKEVDEILNLVNKQGNKELALTVYKKFQKGEVMDFMEKKSFKALYPNIFEIIKDDAPENTTYEKLRLFLPHFAVTLNSRIAPKETFEPKEEAAVSNLYPKLPK